MIFKGEFVTLDPIAHTSPVPQYQERKDNFVRLRRMKIHHRGEIYSIPFISGNALRAILRRPLVDEFLDTIGITKEELAATNRDLYYSLYGGGALDKKEGDASEKRRKAIALTQQFTNLFPTIDEFIAKLPTFSLFGGVLLNRIMEGRINVGNLIPLTKQNAHLYDKPDEEIEELPNCGDIVDLLGFASHDAIRKLFSAIAEEVDFELSETSETGGASTEGAKDKYRPMLYHIEAICPNVTMLTEIFIKPSATELEISAAARAIEIFNEKPIVGLRASAGFGRLKGQIDLNGASSELYLDHINKNASDIKDFIMVRMSSS